MVIAASVALVLAAAWLRLAPARRHGVGGIDAWFYLLYAEALRRQRRLPARLDRYLLDIEDQWYPPLFAAVLALLPGSWRLRAKSWIAPMIDVVHMMLAMGGAAWLGAPPAGVLLAGLVYAVMPIIVMESSTLNSRSLGSLLLSLAMLAAGAQVATPGATMLVVTTVACALVVLTHKMATQLLVPLMLVLAASTGRVDVALAPALGFALAWLMTGGFYTRIFAGHLAILQFWRRHLAHLNAHQVYDSPLYAGERPAVHRVRRYFEPGLRGAWRLATVVVATNPFVVALPWLLATVPATPWSSTFRVWIVVTYAVVLATTFLPPLRFLGEGPKYLRFVALPQAVLAGSVAYDGAAVALTIVASALGLGVLWRLRNSRTLEVVDGDLARVLEVIRRHPGPRVATLPCHFCDVVAYATGKQVLWGAHSAGYEKLEEWYPVIRTPVSTMLDKYDVDLLLVDRGYADPAHLGLGPDYRPVLETGRMTLLERRRQFC